MKNIAKKYWAAPKGDSSFYSRSNGFARQSAHHGVRWYSCREEFHPSFNRTDHPDKGLYYGTADFESAARMFQFVEDLLGLKDTCRSTIYRCRGGEHIFVELSPFWLSLRLRTAFVTIMLRASNIIVRHSRSYNTFASKYVAPDKVSTPLTKLMAISYCKHTPRATAMFLDGYTRLSTRHAAWVHSLGNPTKTKILVRPRAKKYLIYFEDNKVATRLTRAQKTRLLKWVNRWELKHLRRGNVSPTDPVYTIRRGEEIAFNYKG